MDKKIREILYQVARKEKKKKHILNKGARTKDGKNIFYILKRWKTKFISNFFLYVL